jgi:hypothetical protein
MSSNENQGRIVELLTEIAKWSRLGGIQIAREVISSTLQNDAEKLAYQYSDGRASRDVARIAGLSDFTIRTYWKKWNLAGLVSHSDKFKGRYERVFSLENFGIELPATKQSVEAPL